jgi:hypothetical protein
MVRIKRYPTRLELRCISCGHFGVVRVFLDKAPKLVCSRCGDRNPVIAGQGGYDSLRSWSAQRRGK